MPDLAKSPAPWASGVDRGLSAGVPDQLAVMSLWPFWRWAIVPASLAVSHPAIPFYRRSTAEGRARQYLAERDLFAEGILLLRRRRFRSFEVVEHLRKEEAAHA
jgi:hypothetical protein